MYDKKILIIDDEPNILLALSTLLSKQKYNCEIASSGESGIKLFESSPDDYDIVITDYLMPGIDGMQVLKRIKNIKPKTYVIMLTAFGNLEHAVNAIKEGAYDYLTKPYENEKIKILIKQIIEKINLENENILLKKQLECEVKFENIIGKSEKMIAIFEKIKKVSAFDTTVLITGESGTGKELVAKAIHFNSLRKDKSFVPINCAAIPADLLENELFGHEKGAYTGAISDKKGKFELANGGTLFLDEIGDMPLLIQPKILRVIQEQIIEKLGSNRQINVNVRIIAATNKNLEKEILDKKFREDLYYRLNVVNIHLPPLRERTDDIEILVNHFINCFSKKINKLPPQLTKSAITILKNYHWPGNVRELQNVIERLLILCNKEIIDENDILENGNLKLDNNQNNINNKIYLTNNTPNGIYTIQNLENYSYHEACKLLMEQFERDYLIRALKRNNGNILKTSQQIGLNRAQLYDKIKTLNINVDDFKNKS